MSDNIKDRVRKNEPNAARISKYGALDPGPKLP